jgi:serine/threonine-protein kinase
MPPDQIGPYLIEEKVGAGGMGTVYRGRHTQTGQVAAVKVLPATLAREDGFVARFNREIEAMRQLSNPHVVALYDHGEADGTWYYAMEFVEGETLTNRIRRDKRLPWREAVTIAIEICAALKAAHDAGIVHRDLKPSNLLLGNSGEVKLTDFGVAQVFAAGKLTKTGGIVGTAEFMSPEQARGSRATKKSDLYALGAVLYLMLTGQPPFRGKTALEVMQQHQYRPFDKPSRYVEDLPPWLEAIVCELLEKDPYKRPPDAYVLSRRLQEGLRRTDQVVMEDTYADDGSVDPGALTVAADYSGGDPGGATLMRDLVRAEIDRSTRRSPVAQFFDNTWVLLSILALLIVGGVLWFRGGDPAGDEAAGPAPASAGTPDAERFLELAQQYRRMGDTGRARRTLIALIALLQHQPDHRDERRRAERLLHDLSGGEDPEGAPGLLAETERRIAELVGGGQRREAAELAEHAAALYEGDPAAAAALERIDRLLSGNPAPPGDESAPQDRAVEP